MNKKTMKISAIFIAIFMILMVNTDVIKALESGENALTNGVPAESVPANTGWWDDDKMQGFRITLVDKNGKKISGTQSVDFAAQKRIWNPKDHPNDYKHNFGNKLTISKNNLYYSARRDRKTVLKNGLIWESRSSVTFDTLDGTYFYIGDYLNNANQYDNARLAPNWLETYFTGSASNKQRTKTILDKLVINGTVESLISSSGNCQSLLEGYFIVEPIMQLNIGGNTYIGTGTEIIKLVEHYINTGRTVQVEKLKWTGSTKFNFPCAIYVGADKNSFAGYNSVSKCGVKQEIDFKETTTAENGYAVGIFYIKDVINEVCTTTCYSVSRTCNNKLCDNTMNQNERTCSTTISSYTCEMSEADDSVKASGVKTFDLIEGVCHYYCTETATASYPGNVATPIPMESSLKWPSSAGSLPDLYPLTTTSTMTCQIEMLNGASTISNECRAKASNINYEYKNGANSATLTYNDTKTDKNITLDRNCNYKVDVHNIANNNLRRVFTNKCRYSLSNSNVAISKETIEFVNSTAGHIGNYILTTQYGGVVPIGGLYWSGNEILSGLFFKEDYKLQISNLPLGFNGQFTNQVNKTEYICDYNVTTDINGYIPPDSGGGCVCPPGTENSGKDLYQLILNNNMTCLDAQIEYCDKPTTTKACTNSAGREIDVSVCIASGKSFDECSGIYCPYDKECDPRIEICDEDPHGLYCPKDSNMPTLSLVGCVNGGKTYAECADKYCYTSGGDDKYKCPKDSDYPGMDITGCVEYRMSAYNEDLNTARQHCSLLCNIGNGRIIYRTISLENPFPSMDADKSTSQNLKIGMFNDTIRGRYPGANWNSTTVVKNKILENRGYDGSEIYQQAEPLYVIELDAKAIRSIRNYNKTQISQNEGYADFTLECTNGAYCRSTFLRSNQFITAAGKQILTSGTCQNISGKNQFVSCYTYKR